MPIYHKLLIFMWHMRRPVGLPVLVGALTGVWWAVVVPPVHHASITLQLAADQARAPLLRNIAAPGNAATLHEILTRPDVLADAAAEAQRPLEAGNVGLVVLNNQLLAITYRSINRQDLAVVVEALGYHFIEGLLAPERLRLDQLANQTAADLANVQVQLARPGLPAAQREQLTAQSRQLTEALDQLVRDQRLVNTAFVSGAAQALLWFAAPAEVSQPVPGWQRALRAALTGAGLGRFFGADRPPPAACQGGAGHRHNRGHRPARVGRAALVGPRAPRPAGCQP